MIVDALFNIQSMPLCNYVRISSFIFKKQAFNLPDSEENLNPYLKRILKLRGRKDELCNQFRKKANRSLECYEMQGCT